MNQPMYLIYPGMTDFVEVEIIEPASDPGFVMVRDTATNDVSKVHIDRLINRETMLSRRHVEEITTEHNDWINGSWISTTTKRTVIS